MSEYSPPKFMPLHEESSRKKILDTLLNSKHIRDFHEYLRDSRKYTEDLLHSTVELHKEDKKKLLDFEFLDSILKVPSHLSLNILVVENRPENIQCDLTKLKGQFPNLKFYLVEKRFEDLKNNLLSGKKSITTTVDYAKRGDKNKCNKCKNGNGRCNPFESGKINLDDVDLILQDIFLEAGGISGSDFADLYFDVAPQAMVFFLTSMDIETLAASGYDKKVDRLISKDRIIGLMKYYYDRFNELYGQLLWPVFAKSEARKVAAQLTDRTSMRRLLGNIRSWSIEPKILFHGFALPEMVDHEFRHTLGLWKMANKILGPYLERMPDPMPAEDRILLTLAIWLHDIGHRGDEHHYAPMEIRENHGAISESLILEHFESLGIGWLKEVCENENCKKYRCCCGPEFRNKTIGCFSEKICALRKIGLMCRYHQSTAPLTANKLSEHILKLKFPSPYCVIGMNNFKKEIDIADYDKQIEQWLNKTKDFGWFGTDIRTLDEFKDSEQLLRLTGMLRWLDALHTHSDKVGSILEVKSFLSYLEMRKKYCEKRIAEIDDLLDKTVVGSEAYLSALSERFSLDRYSELLEVQGIHLWRSGLVRDIKGEWFWDDKSEKWAYKIVFELYETEPFENDNEIKEKISLNSIKQNLPGRTFIGKWSHHVWEEVIESEIEGQSKDSKLAFFEEYFIGIDICYCYKSGDGQCKEIGVCE